MWRNITWLADRSKPLFKDGVWIAVSLFAKGLFARLLIVCLYERVWIPWLIKNLAAMLILQKQERFLIWVYLFLLVHFIRVHSNQDLCGCWEISIQTTLFPDPPVWSRPLFGESNSSAVLETIRWRKELAEPVLNMKSNGHQPQSGWEPSWDLSFLWIAVFYVVRWKTQLDRGLVGLGGRPLMQSDGLRSPPMNLSPLKLNGTPPIVTLHFLEPFLTTCCCSEMALRKCLCPPRGLRLQRFRQITAWRR